MDAGPQCVGVKEPNSPRIIIKEDRVNVELLPTDVFPAQGSTDTRPPGLHVSDIYSDIDRTLNGEPEHWENAAEPGFLWEDVFSKAWSDKAVKRGLIFRPDPFQVDGVWVSPDGVEADWIPRVGHPDYGSLGNLVLVEYKFTWKSSNNKPEDNWKWMTQIKAYLCALDLRIAHLHVFYCNGDYRQNRRPKYQGYRFTFEEDELLENWQMLLNHARSRGWL